MVVTTSFGPWLARATRGPETHSDPSRHLSVARAARSTCYAPAVTEPEPEPERAAKATLMLALFLTVMGTYGVFRGIRELSSEHLGLSPELLEPEEQARADALAELQATFYNEPNRRPFAASNVVLSAMLMVGSAFLVGRKPHAVWFLRQAILANVLWILAKLGSQLWHSFAHAPEVKAILAAADPRAGPNSAGPSFAMVVGSMVVFSVFNLVAHVFVGWRVGREDVRRFVEGED